MKGKIYFKIENQYKFDYGIVYFDANENLTKTDFITFLKGQVIYQIKNILPKYSRDYLNLLSEIEVVDLYLEE